MWYYTRNDEEYGPISDVELRKLLGNGSIDGNSEVWREGMADWAPLSSIRELQIPPSTNPYAAPAVSKPILPTGAGKLDSRTTQRVEAIIKDAKQIVVAFLMSLLCSIVGFIVIPIWYGTRLYQWHATAAAHPHLLSPDVNVCGTLGLDFQKAKGSLIAGVVFGIVIPIGVVAILIVFS